MSEIGRAFSAMSKNSLMSNFLLSSDISSGLLRFCSSAVKNKNHLVKISGAFHYQQKVANRLPTKVTGSIPTKCGRFDSHQMFHAVFPQNVAGSIPTKSFGLDSHQTLQASRFDYHQHPIPKVTSNSFKPGHAHKYRKFIKLTSFSKVNFEYF